MKIMKHSILLFLCISLLFSGCSREEPIEKQESISTEPSLEVQRMNNDIERMIESLDSDRDSIQKLILECAAKKFNEYKSTRHIADRLKADLERSGPLSSYSPELFDRTVSSVTIDEHSQVQLVLKNGIIVGKEM